MTRFAFLHDLAEVAYIFIDTADMYPRLSDYTFAASWVATSSVFEKVDWMTIPTLPELKFAEIPKRSQSGYTGDRFSFMELGARSSPVVILLHGVGANSMHWRFQYAGLSSRFRVIGWNAPGYLLTDELKAEWPDTKTYADSVRDFLDALKIDRAVLVGNSFGSRVAQGFAIYHGARVNKLVLTGVGVGKRDISSAERETLLATRSSQIRAGGFSYGSGRLASLLGSRATDETHELVRNVLRATNRRGFLQAAMLAASGFSPLDHISAFTMPLLMIQGSEDSINKTDENAKILADSIPGARLEILQGCGHLPEVEMPQAVNGLISEFLDYPAGQF
jgi:pimeloyl-ACP methyl ester carboxylesterase